MDDLLCLDEQYNAEELMIRDSVARFVTQDVTPLMTQAFEHAHFPEELIKKSAELQHNMAGQMLLMSLMV